MFKIWRAKRHTMFVERIKPRPDERMLDVGGYPEYWTRFQPVVRHLDCVNLHAYPWDPSSVPQHSISTMIGDGCALDIPDNAYDISFSNSVIEHVGDYEAQKTFAREILRIGRRIWVQTPAYECPIEPHFLALFIHWLPRSWRIVLARYFTFWGLTTRPTPEAVIEFVDFTRLMTKREFADCFPGCTVITERMLFVIPKSYIAVRS